MTLTCIATEIDNDGVRILATGCKTLLFEMSDPIYQTIN
jgi:hypothetical protein